MFSIGEFSKITGLTVKTLRFYHEQGVLVPTCVDDETGYRYYDHSKIETAGVIAQLRRLDFSLEEISEMLRNYSDDADILDFLVRQRETVAAKLDRYREVSRLLDEVITREREARKAMVTSEFQVAERQLDTMLIAAVRMQARYCDCGKGFAAIARRFGRQMCGKPMLLHYDTEYKELADYEACVPIRKGSDAEGITVRQLAGGRAVTLLHKGPYDDLGRSYERIISYIKEKGYEIQIPSREVYIKGPGMIFKGNPKNYLTEIQMMLKE
jgi:DNA-binding transcriptional MerR regulator